jgi:hypothetical protein
VRSLKKTKTTRRNDMIDFKEGQIRVYDEYGDDYEADDMEEALSIAKDCAMMIMEDPNVTVEEVTKLVQVYTLEKITFATLPIQEWYDEIQEWRTEELKENEDDDYQKYLELRERFKDVQDV